MPRLALWLICATNSLCARHLHGRRRDQETRRLRHREACSSWSTVRKPVASVLLCGSNSMAAEGRLLLLVLATKTGASPTATDGQHVGGLTHTVSTDDEARSQR